MISSPFYCPGFTVTAEELAHTFHDEYERLAPDFGYKTREASAVPWDSVPDANRNLMEAVALRILGKWFPEHMSEEQAYDLAQKKAKELYGK